MSTNRKRVLFVDDETNILKSFKRSLRNEDYNIFTAESGFDALKILGKEKIKVIVCDQRMPNMTGSVFLSLVRKLYPNVISMVLSGYTDFDGLAEAINHGEILKFLSKPWKDDELIAHIDEAFERHDDIVKLRKEKDDREAIMITDDENIIRSINHRFCQLTEYTHNDALGLRLLLIDQADLESTIIEQVKKTGQWSGKVVNRRKSGNTFNAWLSVTAIPDKAGKFREYIHSFREITF